MPPRSRGPSGGRPPARWVKGLVIRFPRKLWLVVGGIAVVCALIGAGVASYYWVLLGREIDLRLHGERERVLPRVYARPLELYKGQALGQRQLIDRLNDLGYAERARIERAGEFAIGRGAIVRVVFDPEKPPKEGLPPQVVRVSRLTAGDGRVQHLTLDPPLLTALIN